MGKEKLAGECTRACLSPVLWGRLLERSSSCVSRVRGGIACTISCPQRPVRCRTMQRRLCTLTTVRRPSQGSAAHIGPAALLAVLVCSIWHRCQAVARKQSPVSGALAFRLPCALRSDRTQKYRQSWKSCPIKSCNVGRFLACAAGVGDWLAVAQALEKVGGGQPGAVVSSEEKGDQGPETSGVVDGQLKLPPGDSGESAAGWWTDLQRVGRSSS